jgi:hypothetical protein
LLIGIIIFATTLFSIVTLPVEYDASNRALAWLENKRMLTPQEQAGARFSKNAARTYVVAALGSIATLLYYISIYMEEETNSFYIKLNSILMSLIFKFHLSLSKLTCRSILFHHTRSWSRKCKSFCPRYAFNRLNFVLSNAKCSLSRQIILLESTSFRWYNGILKLQEFSLNHETSAFLAALSKYTPTKAIVL